MCEQKRFVFVIKETAPISMGAFTLLGFLLFTPAVGQQEDQADEQPETYLQPVLNLYSIQQGQPEKEEEDGKAGSRFDFFHNRRITG